MKITIGNYIINGDKFSLWVEKLKDIKDEDGNTKTIQKRLTGYYSKYSDLLKSFVSLKLKDNDAETVKDLLDHINEAEAELRELADVLVEAYKGGMVINQPPKEKKKKCSE